MDSQHLTQTLQNIFGSLLNRPASGNVVDDDEMPALEPVTPSQTNNSGEALEISGDVIMQTDQSTSGAPENNDDNDDDHSSMPELQSVSNSSDSEDSEDDDDESDRDANEVEMQAVQDDDNDSTWTDDEDMPALEPIGGHASAAPRRTNRRARVDDDEDDERDRRHPSQRVADTMSINEPPPSTAPSTGTATPVPSITPLPFNHPQPQNQFGPPPMPPQQLPQRPLPMPPHMLFRIPLGRFQARNQNAQANNNPNNPNADPNAGNAMFGGFAITIDDNGMPVFHTHHHHHGPPNPDGVQNPDGAPGQPQAPGGGGVGPTMLPQDFTALFNLFGNAMGGFGFGEREPEDPERAKRLVSALEEVPTGLVRRLGRVGGGGLDGEEGASGGDGGCAICWDSLLDGDLNGEGWVKKEEQKEESAEEAPAAENQTETNPSLDPSTEASTSSNPSSSQEPESSVDVDSKSDPALPKIVSLPCAHVFHAACLIPWFSRPRQTTCPTCRFNIDPENLTYVRRRRAPAGGNNNAANDGNAAQAQGGNMAQPPFAPGQAPLIIPVQNAVPATGGDTSAPGVPNANLNPAGINVFPTFLGPGQANQTARDMLANARAEFTLALASARAARDNHAQFEAQSAQDVAAAAAALARAEQSLQRVEQWLQRVGMIGGVNVRPEEGMGPGAPVGNVPAADANVGNVDASNSTATATENSGADGEISLFQ